jgi:hypothetical protein
MREKFLLRDLFIEAGVIQLTIVPKVVVAGCFDRTAEAKGYSL